MKLEFVELAGFRGFREKTRLDLPMGFTVLSGNNGAGKSTVLDAIDFALTGTINKFNVREAKGGGLEEHIWWVGSGGAAAYYVSVGFVDENEKRFVVTRSRESGCTMQSSEIIARLCADGSARKTSVDSLLQTTLIRDEWIAALSLDLPEQARFTLVREAIGNLVGPDYSDRTLAILNAAGTTKARQEERIKELQSELGRVLGELTQARSFAERAADVSEALKIMEMIGITLPPAPAERIAAIQKLIADKRLALQQMERMLQQLKEVESEVAFFASENGRAQVATRLAARDKAIAGKRLAEERLALARRAYEVEKEGDEFAAHISVILEHGEAVGLLDGHCPLCDAVRTQAEFMDAVAAARTRLAARGEALATSNAALRAASSEVAAAEQALISEDRSYSQLEERHQAVDRSVRMVHEGYRRLGYEAPPPNAKLAEELLFAEQSALAKLERAHAILESSNAMDRVKVLETKVAQLRERADQEAARLSAIERAQEAARQIQTAARTVANEILMEQFDTVMPLLKELYRRLRPHADWTEIESDFGGKVRGSLNFVVEGGHNPQFLFSSGQRRAAGLAFLLAVHLSRPWCKWQSLLLDDPVQHIDDYRALNLVEVLAAIRRTNRQVIVAVEDPALADLLCRRLRSDSANIGRIFEMSTFRTGAAEIAAVRDISPMPKLVLREAHAS